MIAIQFLQIRNFFPTLIFLLLFLIAGIPFCHEFDLVEKRSNSSDPSIAAPVIINFFDQLFLHVFDGLQQQHEQHQWQQVQPI